ncbi:hypothetical protein CAPTEDRAFT_191263 [Capitella teleta]|uniref:G-protein coupled receptors family 1 profile domain-containing protein n=1 Tax=Capitella teleta TaxID=283909 RepID=R7UEY5_CAPTE|nr:hypothetical protein CAPTEDRAFT_191263 [Capitella teleta]|eukprot:ELU01842.1 hypothetical protein CAPTEDRAFT_191263 [Capitella teleta]
MEGNFSMDLQNSSMDTINDTMLFGFDLIKLMEDYDNMLIRIHPYEMCFKYIVVALGAIGNMMSFAVLQRKTFRQSSVGFVLSALLVMDTLMLALWCGNNSTRYANYRYPSNIKYESDFMCKLQSISGFLPLVSAWSMVLVTAERLAVVFYPVKAHELCTRRNVMFAWFATALVICFLCLPRIWITSLRSGNSEKFCWIEDQYNISKSSYYVMSSLSILIPSLFLFGANISIAARLSRSQSFRRQHSNGSEGNQRSRSMTAMLLCDSTIFLVLNVLTMIITQALIVSEKRFPYGIICALHFTNLLQYLNNAINFLLYCMSGSQFRNELVKLFRSCKMQIYTFISILTSRSSKADV